MCILVFAMRAFGPMAHKNSVFSRHDVPPALLRIPHQPLLKLKIHRWWIFNFNLADGEGFEPPD
ncbi:MAG: hypothetical protein IKO56_10375, partial [Alphaproteobacteria bacterium]|nr:hypothetical protein [Alphaproteobacteria bacterium]